LDRHPEAPRTSRLKRNLLAAAAILTPFAVSAALLHFSGLSKLVTSGHSGVSDFGYPVNQPEEDVRQWAKSSYGKDVIASFNSEGTVYEFIGKESDRSKIQQIIKQLKELRDEMPIQPDPSVKKLMVIFSDETEGRVQEGVEGITIIKRVNGVQYLIFAGELTGELVKHELIHSLWQTEGSTRLPDFIAEGLVHDFYDPETDLEMHAVDSAYLFSHLDGLYPSDGNLSKGLYQTDAEFLQDEVMRRFWSELSEIDPSIRYKLLQLPKDKTITGLAMIPGLIYSLAEDDKKPAVQRFLDSCSIFSPSSNRHTFVVPDVSEDKKPEVMVYYLDRDYFAMTNELPYWYSSSLDGQVRSPFPVAARTTSSNRTLKFSKYPVEECFEFTFILEDPRTSVVSDLSFVYQGNEWVNLD
jgi:hypothetical protein